MDFRMSLAEAVAAPRFHHQWPPRQPDIDLLYYERDRPLPAVTRDRLTALGYAPCERDPLGDVQAIAITDGRAEGASDPRGIGYVTRE